MEAALDKLLHSFVKLLESNWKGNSILIWMVHSNTDRESVTGWKVPLLSALFLWH